MMLWHGQVTNNEKLELLRENPFIYPQYTKDLLQAEVYRFIIIDNYILFYHINEDEHLVNIARILYGKRDIHSILTDHC